MPPNKKGATAICDNAFLGKNSPLPAVRQAPALIPIKSKMKSIPAGEMHK
jgi:hypothetical protein